MRDVALVIAPLLLAAMLTLAITVVIGKPLNYANIIALPLLLGIGVAFDIYFVMNWRAGTDQSPAIEHGARGPVQRADDDGRLREPGALARSEHGRRWACLLTISLYRTLFCALIVLPALLGPALARQLGAAVGARAKSASNVGPVASTRQRGVGNSDSRGHCPRDAPVAVVEPERSEACNPRARARVHGIARDARIMAGIRNRPFGERPSPAAREPRR